jgi:feruloyl esterase
MTEGRMLFLIVLVAIFVPATLQAQSCESLSKLVSPTVSITLAKTIDAGAFTPAGSTTTFPDLPAFCRVAANLKPTADSDIRAEIWLPISGWNGKQRCHVEPPEKLPSKIVPVCARREVGSTHLT